MQVLLYSTTSDSRNLTKNVIQRGSTLAYIKEDCRLSDPILYLNVAGLDMSNTNYLYIPEWGRFYYVKEVTFSNSGTARVELHVDVLMSFADSIRAINTLIERQEFVFSPYILDSELLTRVDRKITYKVLGSIGNPSGAYIALTVTGGEGASDL